MDFSQLNEVLGLASSAVGLTSKAATTITTLKGLFGTEKAPDTGEAEKLLNALAGELTTVNVMNVQLSEALRALSQQLHREDEFEREKARYSLFQTAQGDYAFKLKDEMADGQPAHFICPVCLNRDKRFSFIRGNGDYKICQADSTHHVQFSDTPIRQPSRRRDSYWDD